MPSAFIRTCLAVLVFATAGAARATETVRVFAAASLTDALADIGTVARESGLEMSVNLAGSNTLVRQILEGARVDVVITADEVSMARLVGGGSALTNEVKALLSNHLVVVSPLDFSTIGYLGEIADARFRRIAIADEATAPAGLYAHMALEAAGLWETLHPRIVPTENVRGALAAVESGNAQAAVVYRTDAAISSKAHIIWQFEGEYAPRIVYPAAVCKSAPNRKAAEKLLKLMSSPKGRAIFEKFGFEVLNGSER